VVWSDAPLGTSPPRPSSTGRDADDALTTADKKMTGRLEEIGVPELLEMLCSTELAGVLVLQHAEVEARITVRVGHVEHINVSSLPDAPVDKCVLRVMGWTEGTFAIRPYRPPKDPRLELSIRHLLVDTLFKLDELNMFRSKLPALTEKLVVPRPLLAPLAALAEAELEMLQIAHNGGTVERALDLCPETDWVAAQRLLRLLDAGYLRRE